MSPRLIKLVANHSSENLPRIINFCLERSTFPDILKIVKVLPLPKKDNLTLLCNYHPTSIFSSITLRYNRLY